jgi:hypothetical protein
MTDELQRLMERIAERAPQPPSAPGDDHDLWASARRAHRRDLVLVPVAALAAFAIVVGTVLGLQHATDDRPVAPAHQNGTAEVPSRIYAMPMSAAKPTRDLALGTLAAVYLAEPDIHPVAVSAMTGAYHRLALPGFDPGPTRGFALSPDGRQLAYAWRGAVPAKPQAEPVPSGIAVVNLADGQVTRYRLGLGKGVSVAMPAWSPNGRWLAFDYGVATKLTRGAAAYGRWRVGLLDTRASSAEAALDDPGDALVTMPARGGVGSTNSAVGVTNDGTVIATAFDLRLWHPDSRERVIDFPKPYGNEKFSRAATALVPAPDGKRVVVTLGVTPLPYVLDVASERLRPLSGLTKASYTALGWAAGSVVGTYDTAADEVDLQLWPAAGKEQVIGTIDQDASHVLSLATGLMTATHPTAEFPKPSWVHTSRHLWWIPPVIAGVLIGVAAELWRRRRGRLG